MGKKDAFKVLRIAMIAALEALFESLVNTDAYRELLAGERLKGKVLHRISDAAMSAVVDPTLRDRDTPTRILPSDVVEIPPDVLAAGVGENQERVSRRKRE